jgi:hypothetical protein
MELRYRRKADDPPQAKFGTYLGQGDGTVSGELIAGAVTWDLFEDQGDAACDANLIGQIRTEDGAEVGFEILGFFKRAGDRKTWTMTSAIRFRSADARYRSLDDCIGVIRGTFDPDSYVHRYEILVPNDAALHAA